MRALLRLVPCVALTVEGADLLVDAGHGNIRLTLRGLGLVVQIGNVALGRFLQTALRFALLIFLFLGGPLGVFVEILITALLARGGRTAHGQEVGHGALGHANGIGLVAAEDFQQALGGIDRLDEADMPAAFAGEYRNVAGLHVRHGVFAHATLPEDRKSTRLNSSHIPLSRMPSSA